MKTKDTTHKTHSAVYDYITQAILDQMEKGTVPWKAGFLTEIPYNASTGNPYNGANIFILSLAKVENDHAAQAFMTYKQAKALGAYIPKGEKRPSYQIIFWKLVDKRTPAEKAEQQRLRTAGAWRSDRMKELNKKVYAMLKYSYVYNIDAFENLDPAKLKHPPEQERFNHSPIENAAQVIDQWQDKPIIKYGGNQPSYSPSKDRIKIPELQRYEIAEEFYSVLFHESAHATGHESRLDRPGIANFDTFGSEKYGFEELIAEMAAAMLTAVTGIRSEHTHQNNAAYIKGWMDAITGNPKMVIQAASQAQKAADYILGEAAPTQDQAED